MAAKTGLTLNEKDYNKALNKLNNLETFANKGVSKVLDAQAEETKQEMFNAAPKVTGRLAKGIQYSKTDTHSVRFKSEAISPESNFDYAPSQNFGGRYAKASMYFTRNIKKLNQAVRVAMSNKISSILKSTKTV